MRRTVADSSYLAYSILEDASMLEKYDLFIAPEIAFYEVVQAIWKHHVLLKRLADASRYLESFLDLVDGDRVLLLRPDRHIMRAAYDLAASKKAAVYDAVFVALAWDLRLGLKTLDARQARMFRS